MLKITKGLMATGRITTYVDDRGRDYVRVKKGGEDFCIAAHDIAVNYFNEGVKHYFTLDEAMKLLEAEGLTMFSKEQASIYKDNQIEINNKLKEMGGEELEWNWYWTSTEHDDGNMWIFSGNPAAGSFLFSEKKNRNYVRPVLNL